MRPKNLLLTGMAVLGLGVAADLHEQQTVEAEGSKEDTSAIVYGCSDFIRGRLKAWSVKNPPPALINGLLDTCVNYYDEHGEFPPSS